MPVRIEYSGSEDGVTLCLSKLTQESKVHSALGNNVRAVTGLTRHEEGSDIRHHAGDGIGAVFAISSICSSGTPRWYSHSMQISSPVHFAHGLLDEVAGFIGEQTVDPAHKLILRLAAELWLTVKGPAEQPVRVLYCNDTTGLQRHRRRDHAYRCF